MKPNKSKKQSDLLKLSFINIDYTIDKKRTTCKILCKVNLDAWENRYGMFTDKMKDKVLKNYFIMETTTTPAKRISLRNVVNGANANDGASVVVGNDVIEREILPFFWVESATDCHEDDTYDEDKGKMIARRKAKRIAYRQMRAFLKDLVRYHLKPLFNSVQGAYNDMDCFADDKILDEEKAV